MKLAYGEIKSECEESLSREKILILASVPLSARTVILEYLKAQFALAFQGFRSIFAVRKVEDIDWWWVSNKEVYVSQNTPIDTALEHFITDILAWGLDRILQSMCKNKICIRWSLKNTAVFSAVDHYLEVSYSPPILKENQGIYYWNTGLEDLQLYYFDNLKFDFSYIKNVPQYDRNFYSYRNLVGLKLNIKTILSLIYTACKYPQWGVVEELVSWFEDIPFLGSDKRRYIAGKYVPFTLEGTFCFRYNNYQLYEVPTCRGMARYVLEKNKRLCTSALACDLSRVEELSREIYSRYGEVNKSLRIAGQDIDVKLVNQGGLALQISQGNLSLPEISLVLSKLKLLL